MSYLSSVPPSPQLTTYIRSNHVVYIHIQGIVRANFPGFSFTLAAELPQFCAVYSAAAGEAQKRSRYRACRVKRERERDRKERATV